MTIGGIVPSIVEGHKNSRILLITASNCTPVFSSLVEPRILPSTNGIVAIYIEAASNNKQAIYRGCLCEAILPPIKLPKLPASKIIPIIAVQTKLLLPKYGDIKRAATSSKIIKTASNVNNTK